MKQYGFAQAFDADFASTLKTTRKRLQAEGFSILATLDMQKNFQNKLDLTTEPYTILSTCHLGMVRKAIEAEEQIGLILPCHVLLYEREGRTQVAAVRPTVTMQMIDNPKLQSIAVRMEQALFKVLQSIELPEGKR